MRSPKGAWPHPFHINCTERAAAQTQSTLLWRYWLALRPLTLLSSRGCDRSKAPCSFFLLLFLHLLLLCLRLFFALFLSLSLVPSRVWLFGQRWRSVRRRRGTTPAMHARSLKPLRTDEWRPQCSESFHSPPCQIELPLIYMS